MPDELSSGGEMPASGAVGSGPSKTASSNSQGAQRPFDAWPEPREDRRDGLRLHATDRTDASRADGFGWDDTPKKVLPDRTVEPGGLADRESDRRSTILVVCTGNVCRSPYMERMLAYHLSGLPIDVTSAGTGALVGAAMEDGTAELLREAGVSADHFAARQLTDELASRADLVLTATRAHRTAVVQEAPRALRTTFALADFAGLLRHSEIPKAHTWNASAAGGLGVPSLVQQLIELAQTGQGKAPQRPDSDVDIVDPFRRGPDVFRQMRDDIDPDLIIISEVIHALARKQPGQFS